MTAVILPQAGYLIAIREPGQVTPGLLTVDGLNSTTADILISSFSQRAQVAHQVTQTIGGPEYVYVFGDVLQDLNVGIIVYPKGCAERANSYLTAWKFYDEQRLQPGKVSIVNLTFAGLNLRGLVVAFQADSDAAAGTAVIRGTLILKGWSVTESNGPSSSGSGSSGSGSGGGVARPSNPTMNQEGYIPRGSLTAAVQALLNTHEAAGGKIFN